MNLARRFFFSLFAYLALTIVLAMTVPSFIHRRDWDKAYETWRKSPTPENEAAFRVQQQKNDQIHLLDSAIGAVILFVLGLTAYRGVRFVAKHLKRSEPNGD